MSDFPTKENPKLCDNGCGTKIYLSNKNVSKRWLPYELNGQVHECIKKNGKKVNVKDEFLQFLMDQLKTGYEEYKKNHPDFAKVVEKEEGKPEGSYGK
jgi:hypothetical protein